MFDAKKDLLTPDNSAMLLIDHQPQMIFGVQSVISNAVGDEGRAFQVPTILTTASAHSFSGQLHPEVQAAFPSQKPIDRLTQCLTDTKGTVRHLALSTNQGNKKD